MDKEKLPEKFRAWGQQVQDFLERHKLADKINAVIEKLNKIKIEEVLRPFLQPIFHWIAAFFRLVFSFKVMLLPILIKICYVLGVLYCWFMAFTVNYSPFLDSWFNVRPRNYSDRDSFSLVVFLFFFLFLPLVLRIVTELLILLFKIKENQDTLIAQLGKKAATVQPDTPKN